MVVLFGGDTLRASFVRVTFVVGQLSPTVQASHETLFGVGVPIRFHVSQTLAAFMFHQNHNEAAYHVGLVDGIAITGVVAVGCGGFN